METCYSPSIGLARECWQIPLALGDLDQLRGEQVLADQAYAPAEHVIQELGERMEDEALRTTDAFSDRTTGAACPGTDSTIDGALLKREKTRTGLGF